MTSDTLERDSPELRKWANKMAQELDGMIVWTDTPQGAAFWGIVHRELKRLSVGYYRVSDTDSRMRRYGEGGVEEDSYSLDVRNGWDYTFAGDVDDPVNEDRDVDVELIETTEKETESE